MTTPVLAVSADVDREALARDTKTRLFAAIELRAVGDPAEAARPPLSVVFVLDASGSMQGPPIEHALRSVEAMLDLVDAGDRVGLVVFSDGASEVVPLSDVGPETRRVMRAQNAGAQRVRATTMWRKRSGGMRLMRLTTPFSSPPTSKL